MGPKPLWAVTSGSHSTGLMIIQLGKCKPDLPSRFIPASNIPDRGANKKREKAPPKKWEKREKGQLLLSFSTLVLQSSTMFFIVESLMFSHFHILVGTFIIELVLYIPTMGFLKCPRSSWASKLDAHPLVSFVELSFIFSSSASVAWQSLLTHIDIYWWASP